MTDRRPVVLLVEDDVDVREVITDVLSESGYEAVPVPHGQAALDWLRSSDAPALILLDLMMPVMDGYQFRAAQQADRALAPIPVVVLTAHGNAGDAVERLGAAAYLRKPVRLEELLDTIAKYAQPKQ